MAEPRWSDAPASLLEARAAQLLSTGDPVLLRSGPLAPPLPPAASAAKSTGSALSIVGGTLVVAALVALASWWFNEAPSARTPQPVAPKVSVVSPPVHTQEPAVAPTAPVPEVALPPPARVVAAPRPTPRPASPEPDEAAMLSEALTALNSGDGQDAKAAVSRYAARFPQGSMRREAALIHARALVLTGENEAALRAFDELSSEPLPPTLLLTWAVLAKSEHGCEAARLPLSKLDPTALSADAQATQRQLLRDCEPAR